MAYVSERLAQFFPILAIDFVPKWSVVRTRKSAVLTVHSREGLAQGSIIIDSMHP